MVDQTISTIDIQMNEYGMSLNQIDNTTNILCIIAEEIVSDFKNAKSTLNDACNSNSMNENGIDEFRNEMLSNCRFELEKIDSEFKKLNTILKESKEFEDSEILTRKDDFKESNLKPLINTSKKSVNHSENSKYVKLQEIIKGLSEKIEDDVVIDSVQNQILKCPITAKPIINLFKNKCGHSYERDAIIDYCKVRNATKKCPYAGCQSTISLHDINAAR